MPHRVQLQDFHERHGHLTEFAGFQIPLWFKGIVHEALAVRNAAGIFDVSHMGRAIVRGPDAGVLLGRVTTNDVAALQVGQGQYSLICNVNGGIKDDVLVFRLNETEYLIVYNAGNRVKDYGWILANADGMNVVIEDVSDNVAMFAVQGPKAISLVQQISSTEIASVSRFGCRWTQIGSGRVLVSRTGYTGEDGVELFVWDSTPTQPENARSVWDKILAVGASAGLEPCGLGARDLLRLEAGLCLYGNDIDEDTNPYEAKLGFVVRMNKNFIGKEALTRIKETGPSRLRIGLLTERKVIPRTGFNILAEGKPVGRVTSGTLSPLLNTGLAMGYVVPEHSTEGTVLEIQVREKLERARIVKWPFYNPAKYGFSRRVS